MDARWYKILLDVKTELQYFCSCLFSSCAVLDLKLFGVMLSQLLPNLMLQILNALTRHLSYTSFFTMTTSTLSHVAHCQRLVWHCTPEISQIREWPFLAFEIDVHITFDTCIALLI